MATECGDMWQPGVGECGTPVWKSVASMSSSVVVEQDFHSFQCLEDPVMLPYWDSKV